MSALTITPLQEVFLDALGHTDGGPAWDQDPPKWKRYFHEHAQGTRYTLVAHAEGRPVGYGSLLFHSQYTPFRESGIPEINDLVVAETWRRQSIASRLIVALESEAVRRQYRHIGLGVGLYAHYGPAQRLYAKLGYVMDGRGITSHYDVVQPGSLARVDDDLVLWLTKKLTSGDAAL